MTLNARINREIRTMEALMGASRIAYRLGLYTWAIRWNEEAAACGTVAWLLSLKA